MLQIIGWLGCAYLAFRALQMFVSNEFRAEGSGMRSGADLIAASGIFIAIGFAIWLGAQGSAFTDKSSPSAESLEATAEKNCREFMPNPEEC